MGFALSGEFDAAVQERLQYDARAVNGSEPATFNRASQTPVTGRSCHLIG